MVCAILILIALVRIQDLSSRRRVVVMLSVASGLLFVTAVLLVDPRMLLLLPAANLASLVLVLVALSRLEGTNRRRGVAPLLFSAAGLLALPALLLVVFFVHLI